MPLISDDSLNKLAFVLIGAGLTWLHQQYRLARSEDVALVNEHIKDIEKFAEAARDYWLSTPTSNDVSLAAKVRAAHAATTLLYPKMVKACDAAGDDYERAYFELYDAATGHTFESPTRALEPEIGILVHDKAARLIHILRSCRSDIQSLSRLFNRLTIDFKS
ncbi:hypothetical protein G6L09_05665 [Agrobacterium rhizogenes]|nr:hypothetical protein [Rhizobium rhizogenes]NTH70045.1 hypothetical protein [Rhizobium rhizogenes]